MSDDGRIDTLMTGITDFIVTRDVIAHGTVYTDADREGIRIIAMGTLAYLSTVAEKVGREDDLALILTQIADGAA